MSSEIPNSSPDATNPAAAAAPAPGPDLSSSPPLPPRKRRLSPSTSPRRSASRSRSRSPRGRHSRSRSRSRSRSPQYPPDGKRRRHNDLSVEVCRDFLRDRCTRSDLECRYAHPHNIASVDGDNKVTACADSLRNNCFRGRTCRYYHPPPRIHEQLLRSIGVEDPKVKPQVCRDFARGKCSRSAFECRFLHHSAVQEGTIVCQDFLRGQCNRISCRYSHVVAHPVPPMSHVPIPYPEMLYMPPPPPPLGVPMMGPPPSPPRPFPDNKNRVEVCRDFLKNMCNRESCRFAHPDSHTAATSDNVEVCRDFKRGECNRPACRFFHPYTS